MRHHHAVHECEICGTRFPEEHLAEVCEAGGRPEPRFSPGDRVRLVGGEYQAQFPTRVFTIDQSAVFLERPGLRFWEEGQPGNHRVFYVLRGYDGLSITFVPEYHLGPAGSLSQTLPVAPSHDGGR